LQYGPLSQKIKKMSRKKRKIEKCFKRNAYILSHPNRRIFKILKATFLDFKASFFSKKLSEIETDPKKLYKTHTTEKASFLITASVKPILKQTGLKKTRSGDLGQLPIGPIHPLFLFTIFDFS